MGFWSKLGLGLQRGVNTVATIAPILPVPDKWKRTAARVDAVEDNVSGIVEDFKKPKPTAPPAKPAA